MPKLDVIQVRWVNDQEVHIDVPGARGTWWARPVPKLGGGEVWELHDEFDEIEGYYESPEGAFTAVSERHDDAVVVVAREREQ